LGSPWRFGSATTLDGALLFERALSFERPVMNRVRDIRSIDRGVDPVCGPYILARRDGRPISGGPSSRNGPRCPAVPAPKLCVDEVELFLFGGFVDGVAIALLEISLPRPLPLNQPIAGPAGNLALPVIALAFALDDGGAGCGVDGRQALIDECVIHPHRVFRFGLHSVAIHDSAFTPAIVGPRFVIALHLVPSSGCCRDHDWAVVVRKAESGGCGARACCSDSGCSLGASRRACEAGDS
jgi:hypothetical protein